MNDKVMVTGGLGMVGSQVCRALVQAGMRPVIYDAGNDAALVADLHDQYDLVQGGIDDLPRVLQALGDHAPRAIVHLAAQVGPGVERFPWSAMNANLLGTTGILECARLTGTGRVLFASSKMVYGPVGEPHRAPGFEPVREDHPREPHTFYGKLKRGCEDTASHYAQLHGLDVVAFRFGASFAPGKPGRSQAIPVMGMIEAAIAGEPYRLERGGEQVDDFCYGGEAANGVLSALNSPGKPGQFRAYNISSGLASFAQVADALRELHPGWQATVGPGLDYRNQGSASYFALDVSKAQREIGFVRKFDHRSAVADYVDLFRRLKLATLS